MTLVDGSWRATDGRLRRWWQAPLGAHAAALALLLAALLPLMTPMGSYTSDEGAYALQVKSLERGGWAYEYRAGQYDPNGDHFPLVLADEGSGQYYAYAKHPAYPLLMKWAVQVYGEAIGLHLLALLAVLGTAAAAWLLAAEIDHRLSRPAFWLAAASPVLANGYLIWAHAPSAAVAGLSLVAAVRVARWGFRGAAPYALVAGLVAGVLLRSEGLLFAAALVAALVWIRLRRDGLRMAAVTGAAFGTPALAAALLERRWAHSIVGTAPQAIGVREGTGDNSYVVGRVNGAWHELFQGNYGDGRAAILGLVVLVAVAALGWLALKRGGAQWLPRLVVPAGLAVAVLAYRLATMPNEPVTGLFAAWPVALLGLVLVRWRGAVAPVRLLGITAALYLAAVVATQYPEGGGLEWGGRFFSPAIPLLAVLAVAGLRDALDRAAATPRDRAVGIATVAAVAAAGAVFALVSVGQARATNNRLAAAVARHPASVTITVEPSLARLGWRYDGTLTWMNAKPSEVVPLVNRLHEAGVHQVAVIVPDDFSLDGLPYRRVTETDEPALAERGGKVVVLAS